MRLVCSVHRRENLSYPVVIEPKLLQKIPHILHEAKWGRMNVIVTDEHVRKPYGNELLKRLKDAKLPAMLLSLPAGEAHKTLRVVEQLAERMVAAGVKRDALIIALGGGVVTDVAGFLASIYMRSIPYLNIPTTLLGMTDAALGGKTGVDLSLGKNLIGTFHQPRAVYIDPDFLMSLSPEEFKNGMAEVIKHAVIADRRLFRLLEKKREKILARDSKILMKMIYRSCRVKQRIVEKDTHETHLRMLLNYGHTIGHGIEKALEYGIPHGEAVSIGMVLENIFFQKQQTLKEKHAVRIRTLLTAYNLPTTLPAGLSRQKIKAAMKADKKVLRGALHVALPKRIGKAKVISLDRAPTALL